MKNYIEFERELYSINNLISVEPYRSDNLVTPWVVGFIPLLNGYEVEISYGTIFSEGYIIGFTLFKNIRGKRILVPYEERKQYDRSFMEDEINDISKYAEYVTESILSS